MGSVRVTVDAEGRLVLPEEIRQSLGIVGGGTLDLRVSGDELRGSVEPPPIHSLADAVAALRDVVPPWKEGEPLLSEVLIAERRAEAARDLAEEMADIAERARAKRR
ncbi:AbrB/MazE/SpoVT family DNA-binding domain-containing protein [Roseomonas sp. AR75]|uniref:AbrB/MazE/SpoVT family DNA-binding domain-containing protein n=1 Tax=Roseomonas sp. AR75 TaxID=2562311 RepID=UPI0010BF7B3A|nr:AbrB/MazE/SpoVT family DNA-binding domain-containing protein [Roseomonas sp. AR75]